MLDSDKRQFWTVLFIVFMGFLGISMPYLIFPALFLNPAYSIVSDYSISPSLLLGMTLAAYPLGQFIGSPILGALSDDYGRKRLLAGTLFLNAIFNLLTAYALKWHLVELLIISRLLSGFMEGNIAIARAMASDIKSMPKHSTFGKINASASIAFLIGPFFGGILIDSNLYQGLTLSTPFYGISLLFVLLAGASLLFLREDSLSERRAVRSVWQRFNLYKRLSVLFQNQRLKFLLLVSTTFTLAVDIFYQFAPVYLTAKWMLAPSDLIIYNAFLCVALALGNGWLAGYVSKRFDRQKAVIASTTAVGALLVGITLAESPLLMLILYGSMGIVIGLAVTLLTVKISDSVSDTIQGEVLGVQIALRVLGEALICLLGGFLLLISPKLVLGLAAVMTGLAMLYYARCAPAQ